MSWKLSIGFVDGVGGGGVEVDDGRWGVPPELVLVGGLSPVAAGGGSD